MIVNMFFFIFSIIIISSALMVVSVKNPVHSVLFLILAFFSASGIFVLLGAEFIAMTLVIVYVGAVAVLFLFVVMMINVNFVALKEGFIRNLPMVLIIAIFFLVELIMVFKASKIQAKIFDNVSSPFNEAVTNTHAIGEILYTKYFYVFQLAGLVLFVAMISAIALTIRKDRSVKRQNIAKQLDRDPKESVAFVKVKTGSGVEVTND